MEKFHGAVVDHVGNEHTREFREVAEVGRYLEKLDPVVGTSVAPEVAVIMDWENEWALDQGARVYLGDNVKYRQECLSHYRPFWEAGVSVDVVDQTCALDGYRLVVIPMGYMLRAGFAGKLKRFVEDGGTAVMTFWSAVVDESDLCFLGGVPGDGLRELFGVWEEESQSYFPNESVTCVMEDGNPLGMEGAYSAYDTCSVIHPEGADALAVYTSEYFAGNPSLTVNTFGEGKAYYIASRNEGAFLTRFYESLITDLGLSRVIDGHLPKGVTAQLRTDGNTTFVFIMNFNDYDERVEINSTGTDLITGESIHGEVPLKAYGVRILARKAN